MPGADQALADQALDREKSPLQESRIFEIGGSLADLSVDVAER